MQTIQNFNVGDVYWYGQKFHAKEDYNNPRKFQDFISERPVVIIGTNVDGYGSVRVVEMTSQEDHQCGIKIMMSNGKVSVIKPYKIHTITRNYLVTYYGKLPDEVLKTLMECVAFHMGFSDKIPEYLKIPPITEITRSELIEYSYRSKKPVVSPDIREHQVTTDAKMVSTEPLKFSDTNTEPIPIIDDRKLSKEERYDKAIEMYLNKVPPKDIAEAVGIHITTLYSLLKKRGIPTHITRTSRKAKVETIEVNYNHDMFIGGDSCRPYDIPSATISHIVERLRISDVYKIGRKLPISDIIEDYNTSYIEAKELKTYCFNISQKNERALYKNFKSGYKFDRCDEWDIVIVNNRPEDILLSKGLTKEDIEKIRYIGETRKITPPPILCNIC